MVTAERRWAAHLLRRAGFGGNPAELDTYAALGYEGAVDRLLAPTAVDDTATEDLVADLATRGDALMRIAAGQGLWLVRMFFTTRPLQEKMTLFWHNHFATAVDKVRSPALMYQQNQLFRERGLGRFDDLLGGVARDPAMIFWLDNNTNRKGHPNENWGRELLELFTIGLGNYTEQDVKENARAFTGWSATPGGEFRFLANQHDGGVKTVLGHTGPWNGDDVLPMLTGMRQTGRLLARKLWRWFVNDTPAADAVERLADVYVASNHDISSMLRALFLSPEFRDEANYYQTVKNPAEFVVGVLKLTVAGERLQSALTPMFVNTLAQATGQMGMALFSPPNVGGWPGGRSWINPGTYFARTNWVEQLLAAPGLVDAHGLAGGGQSAEALVDGLLDLALQYPAETDLRARLLAYAGSPAGPAKPPGVLRLILSSPIYQLN